MKILGFEVNFKRRRRPLSAEVVTALSQVAEAIDSLAACQASLNEWQAGIDENVKVTRQRLETVYRKVYRDAEKGNGDLEALNAPPREALNAPTIIRPGDTL